MAKQMIKALTMLTLVAVLSLAAAVVSANGQSTTRQVANVPFEFVVGDTELQAGTYRIDRATAAGDGLKISGANQGVFRLSSTIRRFRAADSTKLVFHRYGNHYFLAEIWTAGQHEGRQLLKSKSEKAVEREFGSVGSRSRYERVEVSMVQR